MAFSLAAPEPMIDTQQDVPVSRRLRRGLALPIYALALILSFASDLFGSLPRRSPLTTEPTDMLYAGIVSRPAHWPFPQVATPRL
jgi:hypothetical protein